MSEAKRHKQTARRASAEPSTAVPHSVKVTARRALEAAARADLRFQFVNEDGEIDQLKDQLDDLDSEPHRDNHAEYMIIKNRCERLQAQRNQAAAKEENKELTFVCAVCFDTCLIESLRINTPCGHGFCDDYTDDLAAAALEAGDPGATCPTCRATVAAVVQPFF